MKNAAVMTMFSKSNKFIIILLLVLIILISGCNQEEQINKEKLKRFREIAENTEEVKFFIETYHCDGCWPDFLKEHPNLIGCVDYEVKENTIQYWVSEECHPRYGAGGEIHSRIRITIDPETNQIIKKEPKLEYIKNFKYCEKDEDCRCLSGSGLPFMGCENYFHAPQSWAGSYRCEACRCFENSCELATLSSPFCWRFINDGSFPDPRYSEIGDCPETR